MEDNTIAYSNTNENLYKKLSNSWNIIFDFLDINSLFQTESISKFFRSQILLYYETKENSNKLNKIDSNNEKNNKIQLFKKQFLSKYFNLFISINISDKKFCNENKNQGEKVENFEIEKTVYLKSESIFYKNRNQIKQISIEDNKVLILFSTNKFSILEFDNLDKLQKFNEIYSYGFGNDIINKFLYFYNDIEKNIFFIKDNSTEIYILKLKGKNINKYDLKNDYDIFKEDKLVIKDLY